jgi:hypothetical protein
MLLIDTSNFLTSPIVRNSSGYWAVEAEKVDLKVVRWLARLTTSNGFTSTPLELVTAATAKQSFLVGSASTAGFATTHHRVATIHFFNVDATGRTGLDC